MFKTISYEQWEEKYRPTTEEGIEELPKEFDPAYLWTELESDGIYSLSSGNHYVNRTGRYWFTEVPHEFDVAVEDDCFLVLDDPDDWPWPDHLEEGDE